MPTYLGGPSWPEFDAALRQFDFPAGAALASASSQVDRAECLLAAGACLAMMGQPEEAESNLNESFLLFSSGGSPRAASAATFLGRLHFFVYDNPRVANGWFARARTAVERFPGTLEHALALVPLPGCDSIDIVALHADATNALGVARTMHSPDLEAKALGDLGTAVVSGGRIAEGMTLLDEAMAMLVSRESTSPFTAIDVVCNLVSSCRQAGDLDRAREWLDQTERSLGLGHYDGPAFLYTHCQASLGLMMVDLGRWDAAEAALLLADVKAQSVGGRSVGQVRSALAELRIAQGQLAEAETLLAGRSEHPDAQPAFARLKAARATIPTPTRYDDPLGSLTPREFEVLGLIRDGLNNAEIAARLQNSVRTIEHHVSSILTKLGIRTRTEAAVLMALRPDSG